MNRIRFRFLLVLLALVVALILDYFNFEGVASLWTLSSALWLALIIALVVDFFFAGWDFINDETNNQTRENREANSPAVLAENRDVHIARYNHLNAENARYRNLVWKIVAFVWAIYYALLQFLEKKTTSTCVEANTVLAPLPKEWFFVFLFSAAIFATIFHLFCETMVVRNQRSRRALEEVLGLIDDRWAHQEGQEDPRRPGFLFSVFVFGCLTWCPAVVMLILRR